MKKSATALVALFISIHSIHSLAAEPEYDIKSRILSIPSIKIDEGHVYDATLKLNDSGSFDIVGFSDEPKPQEGDIDDECTPDHITLDKFNQLTAGMTIEQVNSLIGCEGELHLAGASFTEFWWQGGSGGLIKPLISVKFGDSKSFTQTYLPRTNF